MKVKTDANLRRRLVQLEMTIKDERDQEIARAVDYKHRGDDRIASYHTGLADGRNSLLAELRAIRREYPADREPIGAES